MLPAGVAELDVPFAGREHGGGHVGGGTKIVVEVPPECTQAEAVHAEPNHGAALRLGHGVVEPYVAGVASLHAQHFIEG